MLLMLLEFVTDREKEKFIEIYQYFERKMYAVAFSMLKEKNRAEDAVSESFLKIIKHFEKFSEKSCEEMTPYVVMIVKNTARTMLKRAKRETALPEEWEAPAKGAGPEQEARARYLVELIRSLPAVYRDVLELAVLMEWPAAVIAKELRLSKSAVYSRLSRGRMWLRKRLEED